MKLISAVLFLGAIVALPATTLGQEARVSGGRSLLELVSRLETEGYGPITEISFDNGRWEVEVYKDGVAYELVIDPATGKTLSQHRDDGDPKPPPNAKKLSEILKGLEMQGYTQIEEVSFEASHWEVEAVNRERSKRELRVDPVTGRVVSDRADH